MSGFLLIARNDVKRQFVQPFAWVVLALTCALLAWQFLVALDAYLRIVPKLANVPNSQGATDLIAIPLLRSLSGLLMLIVPLASIVLGKFLGAYALVALVVVIALAMPLALHFGTDMDLGRLAAAALGLLLYAGALTAIGIACSAWTSHPALAAAAALVIGSFLAMLDMGARFQGIDNALINWLSLSTHLEPFLLGLVASVDIVYFLLLTTLALLFAGRRLDGLRAHG